MVDVSFHENLECLASNLLQQLNKRQLYFCCIRKFDAITILQ